jgi:predicted ATP-grasp superfamily ATP-dependent carboligase
LKARLGIAPLPPVALFDNYWAPTMAFARSLGGRGVPLHVYGSGATRWSRYCSERRPCPPIEHTETFLPWLKERIASGEIGRVAPTTDLIAYYVSSLRELFPPEVRRTIAPLEEVESALIKSRFTAACAAAGQPVPLTRTPESLEAAIAAARELGYPLILKPKSHLAVGTGERGALIHDETQLRARFGPYAPAPGQAQIAERYPELRWPLLQRYVPAARHQVYSVTGVKDADRGIITAALSYKREQWPPDIGTSIAQISFTDERILQAGLRAVDQLVSCGIFELELVADNGRLLAIDWNPRAFGFINLDIARGHDLPWLWLRSTLEPVEPLAHTVPRVALEARHVLLFLLKRLVDRRARRRTQPQKERRDPARPRAWISITGHWSDPLPMLIGHASLLRHPRSLFRSQFAPVREATATAPTTLHPVPSPLRSAKEPHEADAGKLPSKTIAR